MAVAKRSALSVRPRHVLAVVAIGTGLAAFGGCKHHRYGAMRPKFVGPATVVPVEPCPAPGIAAPAFEDEAVTPPSLPRPGRPRRAARTPRGASPGALPGRPRRAARTPRGASPGAFPGRPRRAARTPRGASPGASPADPAAKPDENDGPMPETPRTSRRGTRPAAPVTRQATLRTRLTRYVNDPDDLFRPPKADRSWRYIVLHHGAQPEGGYPEIDREHLLAARRGAAITSSSATGRVARTARSRWPGAGATSAGVLTAATPRRRPSTTTASASAWWATSTRTARRRSRSRPPRRW